MFVPKFKQLRLENYCKTELKREKEKKANKSKKWREFCIEGHISPHFSIINNINTQQIKKKTINFSLFSVAPPSNFSSHSKITLFFCVNSSDRIEESVTL